MKKKLLKAEVNELRGKNSELHNLIRQKENEYNAMLRTHNSLLSKQAMVYTAGYNDGVEKARIELQAMADEFDSLKLKAPEIGNIFPDVIDKEDESKVFRVLNDLANSGETLVPKGNETHYGSNMARKLNEAVNQLHETAKKVIVS